MHLKKCLQSVKFPSVKGTAHFSGDLMRKYSVGGTHKKEKQLIIGSFKTNSHKKFGHTY